VVFSSAIIYLPACDAGKTNLLEAVVGRLLTGLLIKDYHNLV
jgi:hypothetical protein